MLDIARERGNTEIVDLVKGRLDGQVLAGGGSSCAPGPNDTGHDDNSFILTPVITAAIVSAAAVILLLLVAVCVCLR